MSTIKRPVSAANPFKAEENAALAAELATQYEELLAEFNKLQQLYEEQAALLAKLQAQTPLDDVTGLANHKSLESEIERSLATARRHGRTHALLLFRLHDFTTYAALGENTETAILTHLARLLRQNIRPTDIAARIQGGTFAVILNEVRASDNAHQRAAAIAEIISQTPCMAGSRSVHLGVSTAVRPFAAEDDIASLLSDSHAQLGQEAHTLSA
jgi:diguanylate cyclase (GGDEF)-like protein